MAVASPCLDVCKFDRKAGLCVGCFRTSDEIRQWRKLTDHKRRGILSERLDGYEERQAQMEESLQQYGEVFRLETTPPSFPTSR